MKFLHSEDQLDLRDGAQEFLRGVCTVEKLRELKDAGSADLGVWAALAELGLLGFLASEEHGGLGMDAMGFALIAEQAGYVALPEPLTDVAGVAMPVLNALGRSDLCQSIAGGETRVLTMHTVNPYVNQLADNDKLLILNENEVRLANAADCSVESIESIDPLRRLSGVTLDDGVGEVISEGEQATALCDLALHSGALYSAAELLGLAAGMIDMATAYAKERHQFGKPIGSYQAVKHHLSSAFVALEFARPTVYRASHDLVMCTANAELAVAHAKIAATDAAMQAAEVAIQVHGGMGYTFEVDLHLWMKRVWALAGLWGDRNHHMNMVDKALFEGGLSLGPANTFAA
ncbi:MAG: acyl-CoA dehydrogenase [Gammaproteobacteria bacterium]|nr:acyl-CoA dehydrogenase [Gammaproteobacteria bacterium]